MLQSCSRDKYKAQDTVRYAMFIINTIEDTTAKFDDIEIDSIKTYRELGIPRVFLRR